MGIRLFSFSDAPPCKVCPPQSPNPNPHRFTLSSEVKCGKYLFASVHYPDCTTFGGNKILVYKGIDTLADYESLDPHFLENDLSPIMRILPDPSGYKLLKKLMKLAEDAEMNSHGTVGDN